MEASLGWVTRKQGQGRGERGLFGGNSGEHQWGVRKTDRKGGSHRGCEGAGQSRGQLRQRLTRSSGREWGHPQNCPLTKAKGAGLLIHPRVVPRANHSSALPACPTGQGAVPQQKDGRCWQPETLPRAGKHCLGWEGTGLGPDSVLALPCLPPTSTASMWHNHNLI